MISKKESSKTASLPPPLARTEAERLRTLLRDPAERKASASFVIEGPHLLERALEMAATIRSAYFTAEASDKYSALQKRLMQKRIGIYIITAKQSERISDTRAPQGIFALVTMMPVSAKSMERCVLVLDGVQDPGNVGTIIRAAAWFGVRSILLGNGSADPYSPKTLRSTQGEIFSVQCETVANLHTSIGGLQASGYRILTTTLGPAACSLYRESFEGKVVIIFGSEARGISEDILRLADTAITIPRLGSGESLNVAMSAAIILAELARKTSSERAKSGT